MGRRRKGEPVHGWVCLDKPYDLGSTEAVSRVRRLFGAQKAGHAGTLDPLATGVLPIALGEATKTTPYLMEAEKTYRFSIAWGEDTDSVDREGQVTARSDARPDAPATQAALSAFVGEIRQTPPAFSAIRINGRRAYDLARAGEPPDLAARTVVVHEARMVTFGPDETVFEIRCGKGVYVRSLVRDLCAALGVCGHVSALRRLRVGPFTADSAIGLDRLDDLMHKDARLEALLPVETALDDIPDLAVTDEDALRLKQGRPIVLLPRQVETLRPRLKPRSVAGEDASRTVSAVLNGRVVALCEMRAGKLNPVRVFQFDPA